MARTYATEFSDFPAADMPAIPATWGDESWHNETCPHFYVMGTSLHVFIDYADASLREVPECERFSVSLRSPDDDRDLFASDDWAEILAYVGAWETVKNGFDLAEWIYEELRESRLSRLAAIYLKAENDAAAKPCPDLARHLVEVLKISAIAAKWAKRLGWGFHPDTRGTDYVPALSAAEVAQYDSDMAELFSVEHCDPYALALAASEAANNRIN